jgi:hypothetical protein
MKRSLILVALLAAGSVFAGPEEHIAAQTCYEIETNGIPAISDQVPQEICLEGLNINEYENSITVDSYFTPKLFNDLKVNSVARKNENYFQFKTSGTIFEAAEFLCEPQEKVELSINGLLDNNGDAFLKYLDISVNVVLKNGQCQIPNQVVTYKYKLK